MPKITKLHDVSAATMAATSTPILAVVARMAVNELEQRAARLQRHAESAQRVAHNARILITLLEVSVKGRTA